MISLQVFADVENFTTGTGMWYIKAFDILARAKGSASASEDDTTYGLVLGSRFQGFGQFGFHGVVEGIEHFWAIHSDGEDAAILLDEQVLVIGSHRVLLL